MEVSNIGLIFFHVRLCWEECAGHPPQVLSLEAVSQAHSVGPGCQVEEPGMGPHPGTAWPHPNWQLESPAITLMQSRYIKVNIIV